MMADIEVVKCTVTSATVRWKKIPMDSSWSYTIRYNPVKTREYKYVNMGRDKDGVELTDLLPDTEYTITVNKDNDQGHMKLLYVLKLKTKQSIALSLISESTKESDPTPEKLTVYKVKPKKIANITDHVRDLIILEQENNTKKMMNKEKTVLLLGATGAGKTTFIDAIFNYLAEVSFGDDFRFQLTDLLSSELTKATNQVVSQTESITCYRIPKTDRMANECSLNIVDTPGFGDTSDPKFDETILSKIKDLFTKGIEVIHAICIVVPKSSFRLTDLQKKILTSIPKLFGKNVAEIMYCIMTFDDYGEPHVLSTLQTVNIIVKDNFSFNIGNFYERTRNNDSKILQWNKNHENFKKFFAAVYRSQGISIQMSREVLNAREQIQSGLAYIRSNIGPHIQDIHNLKLDIQQLAKKKQDQDHRFCEEYTVPKKKKVRTPYDETAINCKPCEQTCHSPCKIPYDMFAGLCTVFTLRKCTICDHRCNVSNHFLEREKYITEYKTETRTDLDLKKKYQTELKSYEQCIVEAKDALLGQLKKLQKMIHTIDTKLNEVKLKALHSDDMSVEKYIDILVQDESTNRENGYLERIQFYDMIKQQISDNRPNSDLLTRLLS